MTQMHVPEFLTAVLTTCTLINGLGQKSFTFPWTNGSDLQLSYPRSPHGDCVYDPTRDLTTCMRNHRYDDVTSTWRTNPEDTLYIAVNCLKQRLYAARQSRCVCKDRSMAAHPHKGTQSDIYVFCQLDAIYRDMLSPFTSLEVLDLSSNHLFRVPTECFNDLRQLKLLSLSGNQFKSFFDGILCHVPSLEILLLGNLPLKHFPHNLFTCGDNFESNIKVIDLSHGQISNLASGTFRHLSNLAFLDLSYNQISSLPGLPFKILSSLRILDISGNLFTSLSPTFCSGISNVETLRIRFSKVLTLKCSHLEACSGLRTLSMARGLIAAIEDSPCKLGALEHLDLSWNKISDIPTQLLHNETTLTTLDLSHNQIKNIGVETLHHMTELRSLNVSYNRIPAIDENIEKTFQHLQALTLLDVSQNHIEFIKNGSFDHLTSLSRLDLSGNRLFKIFAKSFQGLSMVRNLFLDRNRISHIDQGTFQELMKLHTLDLSNNNLFSMNFDLPRSLHVLNLSHNAIALLEVRSLLPVLRELHLQQNKIVELTGARLGVMPELRLLDLSGNGIVSIAEAFFSLVPRLEVALLSYNDLTLDLSTDVFKGASDIRTIDLSHNQIYIIDHIFDSGSLNHLENLYLSDNNISSLSDLNPKTQPVSVRVINLAACHIKTISKSTFSSLAYLESVDLHANGIAYIPRFMAREGALFLLKDNPVVCSCDMAWLRDLWLVTETGRKISTYDYDVNECLVYPSMRVKSIRQLANSEFLCPSGPNCPDACDCFLQPRDPSVYLTVCGRHLEEVPSGIPADTRVLRLDGNKFGSLRGLVERKFTTHSLFLNDSEITSLDVHVFKYFEEVVLINLQYNSIKSLPSRIFQGLKLLKDINLSHNLLQVIPQGLLENLPSLQNIDISHNGIYYILPETISELDNLQMFRWIHLSGNPLVCACPNYDFRLWMDRAYNRVFDRRQVTCHGETIRRTNPEDFACTSGLRGALKIVVVVLGVCAAVVPSLLFLLYCRAELLAVCYTRYLPLFAWMRSGRTPCTESRLYDAVVLYDTTDLKCSWWVMNTMLPKLTAGRRTFRLYIPQPELEARDTTLYNIQNSRCTIAIVTSSFQQNRFASECFRHAAFRETNNGSNHHVVMVTWGYIDKNNLHVSLKNYMDRKKSLAITSMCFWDKLIHKLPDTLGREMQCGSPGSQLNRLASWDENTL